MKHTSGELDLLCHCELIACSDQIIISSSLHLRLCCSSIERDGLIDYMMYMMTECYEWHKYSAATQLNFARPKKYTLRNVTQKNGMADKQNQMIRFDECNLWKNISRQGAQR